MPYAGFAKASIVPMANRWNVAVLAGYEQFSG
jgi:hypothetical protein